VTLEEIEALDIPDDVMFVLDRIGDELDTKALKAHVAKLGRQFQQWERLLRASEELDRIREFTKR